MKKRSTKMTALCMSCVLALSIVGCGKTEEVAVEEAAPVVSATLSDEYVAELTTTIKDNVCAEVDAYLDTYVTEEEVTKFINTTVMKSISAKLNDYLAKCTLNEEQKKEVALMMEEVLTSVDLTSGKNGSNKTSNSVVVKQPAASELTEEMKTYLSNEINAVVDKELREASLDVVTADTLVNVTNNIYSEIEGVATKLNTAIKNGNPLSGKTVTYKLTTKDIETIRTTLLKKLGISKLNNKTIDAYLKEVTADTVSKELAKSLDDLELYIPVKGVDYFTVEDINAIVEALKAVLTVSDGNAGASEKELLDLINDALRDLDLKDGYTPVKGVDYFTDSEIAELQENVAQIVNTSMAQSLEQLSLKVDTLGQVAEELLTFKETTSEKLQYHDGALELLAQNDAEIKDSVTSLGGHVEDELGKIKASLEQLGVDDGVLNGTGVEDVSDMVTAAAGVSISSVSITKDGNRCYGSITFKYNEADSLENILLFNLDSTLRPESEIRSIALNHDSGDSYLLLCSTASNIRAAGVDANSSYKAGELVTAVIEWYVE